MAARIPFTGVTRLSVSLEKLQGRLDRWRENLERFSVPVPLAAGVQPRQALEPLRNLSRRLREGPGAPVRVAIFGPTGVGKSKLFNSLIGEVLSPSSYRRPFTRRAAYHLHRDLEPIAAGIDGEIRLHGRAEWKGRILIDTPDFDGIEDINRETAERVYLEADAFLFITDIHKYADAATWSYIDRLRREKKRCIFAINKVVNPATAEDFRRRLAGDSGGAFQGDLAVVGDHPGGDSDLLPGGDPGLAALARLLDELGGAAGEGAKAIRIESFALDLERFLAAWDRLRQPTERFRGELARLREELAGLSGRSREALGKALEGRIDPGIKDEVYQELLRRLERIDILRYPRKLIALPFEGARRLLGRWVPGLGGRGRAGEPQAGEDPIHDRNFAAVETVVLDFMEGAERALRGVPEITALLDDAACRSLRLGHAEIAEHYRRQAKAYRDWVEGEASRTAATITGEHKVKFILSQVIYNAAVIGMQVKTAGALTLTEVLLDGALSPLVAKAVGMAISSEQVRAFETQARERHCELLMGVVEAARDRCASYLDSIAGDLGPLDAIAAEVEELRRDRGAAVARFKERER